jgi:hypothetical protein
LLWERPFVERLFGYIHRLEAYVPPAKRIHGYYAMPILAGTELVGAVDPAREKDTFVVRHISLNSTSRVQQAATALQGAAKWVDAESIRLERVTPEAARAPLAAALGAMNSTATAQPRPPRQPSSKVSSKTTGNASL